MQHGHSDIIQRSSLVRSSFRTRAIAFAATLAAASTPALAQNTLAQRVSRAPDGVVHVQFAARPATCGDGRVRNNYPRLISDKLKESVLQGMGEDESGGSAWLIDRARDNQEPLKLRKSALFWAGQKKHTPTKDLIAVYRGATDPTLREHAIFVLSQREDEAALNELMRIAREDGDRQMRSRALFWLGQKDDPRVTKLIGDRVLR